LAITSVLRRAAKPYVTEFMARRGFQLVRIHRPSYPSETSKCRAHLSPYCVGYGVDLGFGGDPITETAIRVDYPSPYSDVGQLPVQLGGDATRLYWFADGVLDYVYSSHLLEDFEDTKSALAEWLRVLKPRGRLILFCPDQRVFEDHCKKTSQPLNPCHKHADFSLRRVQRLLAELGGTRELYSRDLVDIYSWDLVVEKK
jgi:SAM-dependent methyltransferase